MDYRVTFYFHSPDEKKYGRRERRFGENKEAAEGYFTFVRDLNPKHLSTGERITDIKLLQVMEQYEVIDHARVEEE